MQRILDATQYKMFSECPEKWYTRYVEALGPETVQQPFVLGALVHKALQQYIANGAFTIESDPMNDSGVVDAHAIEAIAYRLVKHHVDTYGASDAQFKTLGVERLLQQPAPNGWNLAAKLDAIVEAPERSVVGDVVLPPGVYGIEHKTRSVSRVTNGGDVTYFDRWDVDVQADFQLYTLQAHYERVQGVIVNVLEYARPSEPQRKCPSCAETFPFKHWLISSEPHVYVCPGCGESKQLKPAEPKPVTIGGFRHVITRSWRERWLAQALAMTESMEQITKNDWRPRNFLNCVSAFGKKCDYYGACHYNVKNGLVTIDPYEYMR